tara:strand:+ start:300 stop:1406 length:1107 start_codon:yes stop_codon:yes gene_type:complete
MFTIEGITSIAYYQKKKPPYYLFSSSVEYLNRFIREGKITGYHTNKNFYPLLTEINKLRNNGDKAYPNYMYEPQLHHPNEKYYLSNIANSIIIGCNESGYFNRWISDEYGFRNPKNTHKTVSDLTLIGDSFTEGACQNEDGTIAGYLRSKNLKVANLGKGGSGPLHQLATFVEYGNVFKSKKVIWIIYTGNDLRNLREEKTTKLSNYLDSNYSQNLSSNFILENNLLKKFLNTEYTNANIRLSKTMAKISSGGYGESLDIIEAEQKELKFFVEVATRILNEVKNRNSVLKIVILGHVNYDGPIQKSTVKTIKNFAISNKINYLEFTKNFLLKDKQLYSLTGPHFSVKGYRAIGREIHNWINLNKNKKL